MEYSRAALSRGIAILAFQSRGRGAGRRSCFTDLPAEGGIGKDPGFIYYGKSSFAISYISCVRLYAIFHAHCISNFRLTTPAIVRLYDKWKADRRRLYLDWFSSLNTVWMHSVWSQRYGNVSIRFIREELPHGYQELIRNIIEVKYHK